MAMQLGQGDTGHLIIVSDSPFPSEVKRVEYFRDQKLFNIVFSDESHPGDMSELELPDDIDHIVRRSPAQIVIMNVSDPEDVENYEVPLVHVGI